MAKFAVALCILLVACGTQGSIISDILDSIHSSVDWFVEKVEEKRQELTEGIAETIRHTVDFENKINERTEQIIDEWKQELLEYSDNAENVNWCVSRKSKFEKAVKQVKSDGLECVAAHQKSLSDAYDVTGAAFDEFLDDLTDIKDRAAKCSEDLWTYLGCLGDIWTSMSGETTDDWNTLFNDATALAGEFISYPNTLESCGFNSDLETLTEEREKASAEVQKCLVNLDCTTA